MKPFSLSELQARVRALLRRSQGGATPVIAYGGLSFDTVGRTASVSGKTLSLSAHEVGVLEVLIRRFGRVVSKEQLVEQLYSFDKEVTHNAIEVYVHRLRRKLEGCGLVVRTLYGRGYRRVMELAGKVPGGAEPLCPSNPDIVAQLYYAVHEELTVSLQDVLLRRTGIGTSRCQGGDCAEAIGRRLGSLLGWSPRRLDAELDAYHAHVARSQRFRT